MRLSAVSRFTSPRLGLSEESSLEVFTENGEHIEEGIIKTQDGNWFPIMNGVPCFLTGVLRPNLREFANKHDLPLAHNSELSDVSAVDQAKTNETFSDKWSRFKNYGFEDSHKEVLEAWFCKKFDLPDVDALKEFYVDKKQILEIGPGSGFNTKFMAENCAGEVFSLDVSEAADTTYENTASLPNCHVVKADLMRVPFASNQFDFVIADGVLHHTPNTRAAVQAVYDLVKPGGYCFFYVYRRMGASRSFADAHIRSEFSKLSPEECYAACEAITDLGRELSKLGTKVKLEKPIPVLGVPAGEHDVQRLFYYNFVKCYWNDAFDYETNNMVNFDWYHPHNAWQHTDEEVKGWLDEMGVENASFNDSNPNGISVMLQKPQ